MSKQDEQDRNQNPAKGPTYRLASVVASVLVFYVVVALLDARGLYNWSTRLPVSKPQAELKSAAEKLWGWTAGLGLEEPKVTIESWWLDVQGAHPLLYPKKYEVVMEKRRHKKQLKAASAKSGSAGKSQTQKLAARQLIDEPARRKKSSGPDVLVMGDSIMMTVGPVLKEAVTSRLAGEAVVNARLATGLARPDVFDWVKELQQATAQRKYDYIVMMLGTNDSQDFVENGEIMTYGTSAWTKTYNRRISRLMEAACQGVRKGVIWVALPPMQSPAFARKAARINAWAEKQSRKTDCVTFVGTDKILGDESGQYTGYRVIDGRTAKVRMVDGIHVTKEGGRLISGHLVRMMSGHRLSSN